MPQSVSNLTAPIPVAGSVASTKSGKFVQSLVILFIMSFECLTTSANSGSVTVSPLESLGASAFALNTLIPGPIPNEVQSNPPLGLTA